MISTEQYTKVYKLIAAGTTNATQWNAQPCFIGRLVITNTSAAMKFVKLYDIASGLVVGTTVPTITIGIPATTTIYPLLSYCFTKGLAMATTTLVADNDATAVTLNDLAIQIFQR